MSLRFPFHATAVRRGTLALLCVLGQAAHASLGSPQLVVSDAPPVVDSGGNQTMRFHVDALINPVPITCQPSNPACNTRSFRICVDYTTLPGTATPGVDFVPRSGRIDTVLVSDGLALELAPVGFVDVTVLGDQLAEGKETVKLQLRLPAAGDCPVQYGIQRPTAVGEIGDGVFGAPDLAVQQAGIGPGCAVQFSVRNVGTGTVPDAAYTSATQPSRVRVNVNGTSREARLADIDPQRLLQTPGALVMVPSWFNLVGNPPKMEGSQQMQVTVDVNGVIVESLETNNTLRGSGTC